MVSEFERDVIATSKFYFILLSDTGQSRYQLKSIPIKFDTGQSPCRSLSTLAIVLTGCSHIGQS